jgi:hypothetical protein
MCFLKGGVISVGFSPWSSVPSVVKGFGSGSQRWRERTHSAGGAKEPSPGAYRGPGKPAVLFSGGKPWENDGEKQSVVRAAVV